MLMRVAAIVFLFLIRLRFPKSKSISDIIRGRYSQSTLKRIRKFEKLDFRLRKAELDLELLLRCRDNNGIPNFLNFRVSSHYLKASLTYRQCQLKLLQEEIRHKKSDIRVLKKEFNSSHSSLQHEISFIDFAHVSSLFLRSNNRILASKSAIQQRKLSNLVKSSISIHDPNKVIFNFSKYELSDGEKGLLAKGLNFSLPPKYLDYADYLANFELFYRNIRNLDILPNEDLDFVKTRIKEVTLSTYRNYNNNVPQHLSKEEFLALQNLRKNKNIVIQKSDKGNSVVVVNKADYLNKTDNLLNDTRKFEKINPKNDGILNFAINQEKRVDNIFKKLVASKSISEETRRSLKPVGTRPGIMYGLCKVHKDIVENCPPFRPILSAINTPTYKLAKFLVPILKSLSSNEHTVKDSFAFAEEIVEQDSECFMGSLDVDSLFTNIPLEETIDICTNSLFENMEKVEGLSKIEFKELLSLATKESYFVFNGQLYKQVDGVALGSPVGPTLAKAFLFHFEKNWLRNCPSDFKPPYYRRYVDDIFVLFTSPRHLEAFRNFLNGRHANLSFTIEREKQNTMSFLDIAIIREHRTFTTSVNRKPTFSGVYTHFDSFLPSTYKFDNVYTLAYRCFRICSSWTKLHNELVWLKETFLENGYPEDFINKCFKKFLDNIHIVKETTLTVEKKSLVLVLPYLGSISLQTRTKLRKSLKNILNCSKLQIMLKNKTRLGNNFHFKDQIPKDLTSGVVYKFQCGLCNESYYGECIRHLNVRIGEHIGISPLTRKQVKPKNSAVADHLLLCNHWASYDDFSILTRDNSKFLLVLKESLLILRDKPSLNRNITSAPLYLFDKA